jgi:hypothetical protein
MATSSIARGLRGCVSGGGWFGLSPWHYSRSRRRRGLDCPVPDHARSQWNTRTARIRGRGQEGDHDVRVETDGSGRWQINGSTAPELDGCLDIDLESSACTNTIPVQRLRLEVGQSAEAPAVYVRALDLSVERLEQQYTRLPSDDTHWRYYYRSPAFDLECTLRYDNGGFVVEYPGIASRVL